MAQRHKRYNSHVTFFHGVLSMVDGFSLFRPNSMFFAAAIRHPHFPTVSGYPRRFNYNRAGLSLVSVK